MILNIKRFKKILMIIDYNFFYANSRHCERSAKIQNLLIKSMSCINLLHCRASLAMTTEILKRYKYFKNVILDAHKNTCYFYATQK